MGLDDDNCFGPHQYGRARAGEDADVLRDPRASASSSLLASRSRNGVIPRTRRVGHGHDDRSTRESAEGVGAWIRLSVSVARAGLTSDPRLSSTRPPLVFHMRIADKGFPSNTPPKTGKDRPSCQDRMSLILRRLH